MKKRTKILLILLAVLLLLFLPGFYNGLAVRRYTVEAPGVAGPVRIALITDLHSCAYGEGQRELLDTIDKEAPDLILLGGDIFDDDLPDDNAELSSGASAGVIPSTMSPGTMNTGAERPALRGRWRFWRTVKSCASAVKQLPWK